MFLVIFDIIIITEVHTLTHMCTQMWETEVTVFTKYCFPVTLVALN